MVDNTDEELDGDSQDDSQDDENIYEVQKIVAKRIMNGRPEYYIRWKGYGRNYDSWEPVSCLDNCQVMLENFERHWKIIEEEDERKASKGKNGKKPGPASKKKVVEEVETKNADVTPPKKAKKPEPPMIVGQKEILDKYGDVADFGILEKVQEIRRNGKCKVALLKFKDHEDPVLADYELIKENYASSVIAYYESVTTFKSPHKA
ncbi:Heterochromatin protein 1 [Halotydeus destructor]|nr:Heterochromatin protein 1 [Halotydeus destructor]